MFFTEKSVFLLAATSLFIFMFVSPVMMFFMGGNVAWPLVGTSAISSLFSGATYLQITN